MIQLRVMSIGIIILFIFFLAVPQVFAEEEESMIFEKVKHSLGYNCVLWARSVEPRLPMGLYTQADKNAYINAQEPYAGAIAVTTESAAGHIAIVRGTSETSVLIEEANYIPGYVTTRAVPRTRIVGYIVFGEDSEDVTI